MAVGRSFDFKQTAAHRGVDAFDNKNDGYYY